MEEGCRNDFLSPPLEVAMDFVQPGSVKESWQGTRCLADENHKCEMTKGRERENDPCLLREEHSTVYTVSLQVEIKSS